MNKRSAWPLLWPLVLPISVLLAQAACGWLGCARVAVSGGSSVRSRAHA